jgi:hypothetical protein
MNKCFTLDIQFGLRPDAGFHIETCRPFKEVLN